MDIDLKELARQYINGDIHPEGSFQSLVWVPDPSEVRPCCIRFLRKSSRARALTVFRHCKSIEHLAVKFEVSQKDLRREIQQLKKEV